MKYALGIEYHGTQFFGYQKQQNLRTVQGELEHAISLVANHIVSTTCSGRTDRGVHAFGQVVSFETSSIREDNSWFMGINTYLPVDLAVTWVKQVDERFDARRSALQRRYCYVIHNSKIRTAMFRYHALWCYRPLDIERMQKGAQFWIGEHDFSSFRDAECQSTTPVRELKSIDIERHGDLVLVYCQANAFLHHMIRNMVGVLIDIGTSKLDIQDAKNILDARDRQKASTNIAPEGLYFLDVCYPEEFDIPSKKRDMFSFWKIN